MMLPNILSGSSKHTHSLLHHNPPMRTEIKEAIDFFNVDRFFNKKLLAMKSALRQRQHYRLCRHREEFIENNHHKALIPMRQEQWPEVLENRKGSI